eukprot:COSAG02_NODE_33427_length_500_cov_0.855362_1_plen_82_part_01
MRAAYALPRVAEAPCTLGAAGRTGQARLELERCAFVCASGSAPRDFRHEHMHRAPRTSARARAGHLYGMYRDPRDPPPARAT